MRSLASRCNVLRRECVTSWLCVRCIVYDSHRNVKLYRHTSTMPMAALHTKWNWTFARGQKNASKSLDFSFGNPDRCSRCLDKCSRNIIPKVRLAFLLSRVIHCKRGFAGLGSFSWMRVWTLNCTVTEVKTCSTVNVMYQHQYITYSFQSVSVTKTVSWQGLCWMVWLCWVVWLCFGFVG